MFWGRNRIHFDFGVFRAQLAQANWIKIALSAGCIYLAYAFRSVRWARLLKHNKKVGPFSLLGTQVIGFTARGSHRPRRRSGSSLSRRKKNRPASQLADRCLHR